jgi:hypothetical protein
MEVFMREGRRKREENPGNFLKRLQIFDSARKKLYFSLRS